MGMRKSPLRFGLVLHITALARRMSFAAPWGSADGAAFDAEKFLADHPQFDWMHGVLKSRPAQPGAEFSAGEKN